MISCCCRYFQATKGVRRIYTSVSSLIGDKIKRNKGVPSQLNTLTNIRLQSARKLSFTGGMSKPEVTVDPGGHLLVDDELHICVRGLDKHHEVTIHTTIRDSGKSIESCCQFRADRNGVVDLCYHPSLSGSYTGISSMGLFWSMSPSPDMPKGFIFVARDMDKPVKAEMYVYKDNLTADMIKSRHPTPLTTHTIDRWYKGQGIIGIDVADGRLRGKLFLPSGSGPFQGVIDLFGVGGGITEYRSALLASRGIASFALPYYCYKDLPKSFLDIDLDYFLEAVSWLRNHPMVYGKGVGVIGSSKGSDIGYMMAANCPEITALVNINGCTFNINYPMQFSGGDIPAITMDKEKVEIIEGARAIYKAFDYNEQDLIPVWRYNPKVLNIISEDDKCGPTDCVRLMKHHYPKDKADDFAILSYTGAGHLLEPPYSPCFSVFYDKTSDIYLFCGGKKKQHAEAQESAWKRILDFFHTHIETTLQKSRL